MQLIPAIDLKNKLVVHADNGDRNTYRPLSTTLFPSAQAIDVIAQLNALYGADTFYLADLDAITLNGCNDITIKTILSRFPDFTYWLDAGICTQQHYTQLSKTYPQCTLIVATETLTDINLLSILAQEEENYILSFDFKNQRLVGDTTVLTQPKTWPDTVIALALDKVGGKGIDLNGLKTVQQYNQHSKIIPGGGVRHQQDLDSISAMGISTVLVGHAFYTGALSP